MSSKVPFVFFPEFQELRKTLRDLQGQFVSTKPKLDAALSRLVPGVVYGPLIAIGKRLDSPLGGEPLPTLVAAYDAVYATYEALDRLLSNPKMLASLQAGEGAEVVVRIVTSIFGELLKGIGQASSALIESSYGVSEIEQTHILQRKVELTTVLTNTTFEVLDILPEAPEDGVLARFFDEMAPNIDNLGNHSAVNIFREELGYWRQRWESRPDFRLQLEKWVRVAMLELLPTRSIDRCKKGDLVVRLTVLSGTLQTAAISAGRLPAGLALSSKGNIEVSDPAKLLPGYFDGLEISGTTNLGFVFKLSVPEIVFGYDEEATYIVEAVAPISELKNGTILAYPKDLDGDIVEAQVTTGNFPPGIRFHTATSVFSVADQAKLREGSYALTVTTMDSAGGETQHQITLAIGAATGNGSGEIVRVQFISAEILVPQPKGAALTQITADGSTLLEYKLVEGKLPEGIAMDSTAKLLVTNPELLTPGRYTLRIQGIGANKIQYLVDVILNFVAGKTTTGLYQTEAQFLGIELPLIGGETIATVTVDQLGLKGAKIVGGSLPTGLLFTESGEIIAKPGQGHLPGTYEIVVHGSTHAQPHCEVFTKIELVKGLVFKQAERTFSRLPIPTGVEVNLVQIVGKDMKLVTVEVESGKFPQGLSIAKDGQITVLDSKMVKPGPYAFRLVGKDTKSRKWLISVKMDLIDLRNTLKG